MSKYGNVKTERDGMVFASKREAARYQELCLLARVGNISALVCQPRFPLVVNEQKVATYIADFQYIDTTTGKTIIEDSKGVRTQVYVLKRKLMKAIHGIDIIEV